MKNKDDKKNIKDPFMRIVSTVENDCDIMPNMEDDDSDKEKKEKKTKKENNNKPVSSNKKVKASDIQTVVCDADDDEQADADSLANALSPSDIKQFFDFVLGNIDKTPDKINKLMHNLSLKMQMVMGANIVRDFNRQIYLTDFTAEAEKRLFNKSAIPDMDDKELQAYYGEARNTLLALQDAQRKFLQVNRDGVKPEMTEADMLLTKLLTLPPDKMRKVTELLNRM